MLNPFAWIREAARNAFVRGIQDGMMDVVPEGVESPTTWDELFALMKKENVALPPAAEASEPEAPVKKARK